MFKEFKLAVQKQFALMMKHQLFRVQLDKDALWALYLASFPEGTNPMFKTRTEYDCQCCKSFVRAVGNVVAIIDGKIVTIWDGAVGHPFTPVSAALAEMVKSSPIDNIFLHTEKTAGTDRTFDSRAESTVSMWEHFFVSIPNAFYCQGGNIGPALSESRSTKDVMLRSLTELSTESVDTVLELIAQGSLYKGDENKFVLESFKKLKKDFSKLATDKDRDIFCWANVKSSTPASVLRIRNTSIGQLLIDLSAGMELEAAVGKFEAMVAPTNYKRPTALITKSMIENAKKKIEELGLTSALDRRYATINDITINNILFANREAKKSMDVFDTLPTKASGAVKSMDKVEEVSIEKFLADILPKAESIELMMENRHSGNLVSLIAPLDPTSKLMFKWPNPFSWAYNGDLTDSMKERVKQAGGKIDGDLRFSIQWNDAGDNNIDFDAHCKEPSSFEIYYGNKGRKSPQGGMLDVDIISPQGKVAVENIVYDNRRKMKAGVYQMFVQNFSASASKAGFSAEVEFDGVIHSFVYDKSLRGHQDVGVAQVECDGAGNFKLINSLPSTQASKEVWGVKTHEFQKVSVVMNSPNYWDDKASGNKHFFFMLEGCANPDKARGFFNEFLTPEMDAHRKVFEVLGSKLLVAESANQLSGLGFSSTQRNSVLCRVKGSFSRVIKVVF